MATQKIKIIFISSICLLFILACSKAIPIFNSPTSTPVPPTSTPIPPETLLAKYIPNQSGGFSPKWVAYIFYPTSDSPDQEYEVEINGTRMGPYTSLSTRVEVSPNGDHIALAVEQDGKWVIIVDGQEKWQHEGLAWAWWSWGPDLEGKSFIPQTQAAIMEFSPSGNTLAYMVSTSDEKWAFCQNGDQGQSFENIYLDFVFKDETLIYHAQSAEGEVVVYGDKILGPFEYINRIKQSPNGEHVVFYGKGKDGNPYLYLDGKDMQVDGEITGYEVSDSGDMATIKLLEEQNQVYLNDQLIAENFSDLNFLTLSPDGEHLAFWGQKDGQWRLIKDQEEYPVGNRKYFYYESGGITYSIMWDPTSTHVAYFIKDGEQITQMVDKEAFSIKWEGLAINVFVDEQGEGVGSQLMTGPTPDKQAYVACLLVQKQTDCDPFSSMMIGDQLAYRKKGDEGSSLIIGNQIDGPYEEIAGFILGSKHYGFVAKIGEGYQVVLDGKLMDKVYDSIYLPQLEDEFGVTFLGIRNEQIFNVFLPWP